ncbi:MAG: hypothetical protein R6V43_00255 [Halopseudomonas sp.]
MRWLISCASMLYEGEQTLLNELTLLLANLLVALWRVARCPTAADRLLAANNSRPLRTPCSAGIRGKADSQSVEMGAESRARVAIGRK